ncbi:MAG: DNA-deoxyinosine glycosylase [Oscillospiraceae bacterium]|jgi:TDG/mug DNA glycosylase family protein
MASISHPIPPVYDQNAEVLILGSFPSVKSREGHFFYHHPQNRFWSVLAAVTNTTVPQSIEEKKTLLLQHHIALWDVIQSCEITGSSDSSIRNVVPNDLRPLLEATRIRRIYCNGGTAHRLYLRYLLPQLGISPEKLPSTSPANAAWSLDRLIAVWQQIVDQES